MTKPIQRKRAVKKDPDCQPARKGKLSHFIAAYKPAAWANAKKTVVLFRTVLEALLIAAFVIIFIVQSFRIPSGSMHPTLQELDRLFVCKFIYGTRIPFTDIKILPFTHPAGGQVVVFRFPKNRERDFIKRCIGTPGDVIEVRNKKVFLNGRELNDPYAIHVLPDLQPNTDGLNPRDNFGPFTVPPESYFMMGDNRDQSEDSRFWGTVPEKDIIGRAFLIYWPLTRLGLIK